MKGGINIKLNQTDKKILSTILYTYRYPKKHIRKLTGGSVWGQRRAKWLTDNSLIEIVRHGGLLCYQLTDTGLGIIQKEIGMPYESLRAGKRMGYGKKKQARDIRIAQLVGELVGDGFPIGWHPSLLMDSKGTLNTFWLTDELKAHRILSLDNLNSFRAHALIHCPAGFYFGYYIDRSDMKSLQKGEMKARAIFEVTAGTDLLGGLFYADGYGGLHSMLERGDYTERDYISTNDELPESYYINIHSDVPRSTYYDPSHKAQLKEHLFSEAALRRASAYKCDAMSESGQEYYLVCDLPIKLLRTLAIRCSDSGHSNNLTQSREPCANLTQSREPCANIRLVAYKEQSNALLKHFPKECLVSLDVK